MNGAWSPAVDPQYRVPSNQPKVTPLQHSAQPTGPDALVSTSSTGTTIDANNFRRNDWKPAIKAAGLPEGLRVHDLRHTTVSMLANAGVPITSIKNHVGHSTVTTTIDRYTHLHPETRDTSLGYLTSSLRTPPKETHAETDRYRTSASKGARRQDDLETVTHTRLGLPPGTPGRT